MVREGGDTAHSTISTPVMEQASHFGPSMGALPAEFLSSKHESHAQSSSFLPTRIPASQVSESKTHFPSPSHFSSPQCHASASPINTCAATTAPRPHPPPMGFAETVKLVATCTAAATAAALASQRVSCSPLHPDTVHSPRASGPVIVHSKLGASFNLTSYPESVCLFFCCNRKLVNWASCLILLFTVD